jgi:hypothetical protein
MLKFKSFSSVRRGYLQAFVYLSHSLSTDVPAGFENFEGYFGGNRKVSLNLIVSGGIASKTGASMSLER